MRWKDCELAFTWSFRRFLGHGPGLWSFSTCPWDPVATPRVLTMRGSCGLVTDFKDMLQLGWKPPASNWVVVSNMFHFHPYLGKIPILTNIFQCGWNHQVGDICSAEGLNLFKQIACSHDVFKPCKWLRQMIFGRVCVCVCVCASLAKHWADLRFKVASLCNDENVHGYCWWKKSCASWYR